MPVPLPASAPIHGLTSSPLPPLPPAVWEQQQHPQPRLALLPPLCSQLARAAVPHPARSPCRPRCPHPSPSAPGGAIGSASSAHFTPGAGHQQLPIPPYLALPRGDGQGPPGSGDTEVCSSACRWRGLTATPPHASLHPQPCALGWGRCSDGEAAGAGFGVGSPKAACVGCWDPSVAGGRSRRCLALPHSLSPERGQPCRPPRAVLPGGRRGDPAEGVSQTPLQQWALAHWWEAN